MLYLPKICTYLRWHFFMSGVHWCQNRGNRGELAPLGRTILTKMMKYRWAPLCVGADLLRPVTEMAGYLKWREGVSCRTSSPIWGSWYFPRFLLRDGSLTQMFCYNNHGLLINMDINKMRSSHLHNESHLTKWSYWRKQQKLHCKVMKIIL